MTIKVRGSISNAKSDAASKVTDEVIETASLPQGEAVSGRGLFVVNMLEKAVSVEGAFLAEDGNLLRMPAVFPNREYALAQVEELRNIINRNFDEIEGRS